MTLSRLLHGAALALVLLAQSGCASGSAGSGRPALVVVLVVDGLPQRQLLALCDQLAPDGFARFLDRGASFSQAHYRHAYTVTASGHAAILTGAYPDRTGIIGNEWRDPVTGASVYNTADAAARYIGHRTDRSDGTSPKNLKVETVGDVLRGMDARSRVISISGKDRGAILPAGKRGTAYMYMDETGEFASSTYYMAQHPAWVDAFHASKPADRFFKAQWTPLLPEAAYARSLPDGQPWYAPGGGLPMTMGATGDSEPGLAYYQALLSSPFADRLTLDFARAAIAGEQLGQDASPDILVVSLSGHDYVNHRWSAESRLSHDHLLQVDRLLEAFFADLDAAVGRNNYVAVLTSDHGFMPAPQVLASRGEEAGRVNSSQALARLNARMAERFGAGRWVTGNSASSLVLDNALIAERGHSVDDVADEARRLLLAEPGFAAAYTRRELMARHPPSANAPLFGALRRAWHPDVSGEVQYALKPNWMFGSAAATHGSPYGYDTHVPVLVYGPAWVRPGRIDTPVEVIDIAPTVAGFLGVPPPSGSEGRALPLQAP